MAGVGFSAVSAEIATGSGSAKTLLQLVAAANHAVIIELIEISFDGTSSTGEPIKVDFLRQTTAGTMSALTLVKYPADEYAETLQTTAQHTATVEPTAGDVLRSFEVHPQLGKETVFSFAREIKIGGGDRLGIRVTAGASINAIVSALGWE